MTYMAVMPRYGKKDLKFFISGTERLMTLKLGMQHWGLWFCLIVSMTTERFHRPIIEKWLNCSFFINQ